MNPIWLAIAHGAFYILLGLWPVLHLPSFEAVTGTKGDVGRARILRALIGVIGIVILNSGLRHHVSLETYLLASGSAIVLALYDLIASREEVPANIFLMGAAVEMILVILWIVAWSGGFAQPTLS